MIKPRTPMTSVVGGSLTQKVGNANNIVLENVELKFVVQVFAEERLTNVVIGQTK